MCEEININVNETNENINIISTEIVEVIDINVGETIEEVTLNITEEVIQVNINKVTGGGGNQDLQSVTDIGNTTTNDIQLINDAETIYGAGGGILLDNGSRLREGTIDAGNGGSKGIAQICGVGYEHKWEAGRLYIMNDGGTIIREVSHNLIYTPTATDDVTKGFVQNTRWILDNGDVYVCTDPTEGAAVWEFITGAVPTLQQVTDEGNITTNDIEVENANYFSIIQPSDVGTENKNTGAYAYIGADGVLGLNNGDIESTLKNTNVVNAVTLEFPDKPTGTYTIATTEDITTPTFQQVTDEGNTTTNDVEVNSLGLYSNAVADYGYLSWDDDLGLSFKNHTTQEIFKADKAASSLYFINSDDFTAKLDATLLTDNRAFLLPDADGTIALTSDIPAQGVTSVGLTMPSAFSVTNSPITSSGDIAVTGAGLVSQYVRGDGTLANFPTSTGGGSSVNYYLNGSISQGTFGGTTYYQMSKTPILGAGTNFTRTNGAGNGYIASFITDVGDPSFLNIPGGNWNLEFYFQSSSTGGSPQFYGEIYKVSATNVFTLVASGSTNPENITNGTTVDQYFTSISVPQTSLLITDRLAIRIYVITSGRTITLHTENGNLCEVLTTFTTGLTALNGLTAQVQNLSVGTSGSDFAISSASATHTFNLPTASASNRGALSSTDWSTFNNKQNASTRRNANNSSNNNINYCGVALGTGISESSAVWTITRLTIAASGSITTATATNVAWTNRQSATYI